MQINIYKEATAGGKTILHPLNYPGCIVKGETPESAWQRLEEGFQSYLCWQRKHGLSVPTGPFEFVMCEEKRGAPIHPGNKSAYFNADEVRVGGVESRIFLRLLAASREDLLTIIQGLPEGSLNLWEFSPAWSINEILRHIAAAERFYITRLFPDGFLPRSPQRKNINDRLQLMRQSCVEVLEKLTDEQLSITVQKGDEYWSARKVFRRFIEHEREHTGQILRILVHQQMQDVVGFDFYAMANLFRGISWKECDLPVER